MVNTVISGARNFKLQPPLRGGSESVYVPPTARTAALLLGGAELGGNTRASVTVAPGTSWAFVYGVIATEPRVADVISRLRIGTLPLFVMVTKAT